MLPRKKDSIIEIDMLKQTRTNTRGHTGVKTNTGEFDKKTLASFPTNKNACDKVLDR